MLKKIFTVSGGECPNGLGHKIDSPNCRKCRYYFRQGTGTFFFWCNFPQQEENSPKPEEKPKRRGRPRTKKTPPKVESIFGKKRKRRTVKKK